MEETGLRIRPAAASGLRAVFDLASTKTEVGRKLAPLWGSCYAGFHPMAGKERGGLENADPDLFDGAVCAVVPFENTGEEALSLAEELAEALGGRPLRAGAEEHDAAAACISHFPVLVAASLALLAGEEMELHPLVPLLAAGGFRDTTRVAGGLPQLGADMASTNGEQIRRLAGKYRAILDTLLAASPEELEALLARAARCRETVLAGKDTGSRKRG
jgi:prephenate dehydrogenase